ncbi:sialic acid synthase [Paenibacillus cisolokensis]|jgi:N-acetylneuraminate synthase|uniref:Sialic acid synthase n=1 Tax=Paenibacillus cisolokensis TaxID=1658519 RepID=A0ABQ4N3T1_9BACL|nr:N-acetylneuraminate synthase [Paenibacillus cisolokensis]GIQ62817.1 sialic acid synthase [Paenibacillus cisolokensis]
MTSSVYIIAEAGVNHNGSLDLALQLVEMAAEAGANAVKFQTFKAERLVTPEAGKADYQKLTTSSAESQFDMLKRLELDKEAHFALLRHCQKYGIEFMSTPFDEESLHFLADECGVKRIKLPSGEITNGPLLLAAARKGLPIILSTGMATLGEIETALMILAYGYLNRSGKPDGQSLLEAFISEQGQAALRERVTLLHCTTEYPAPLRDVNLRCMDTMAEAFGVPVGYSDHTEGIAVSLAAAARGAAVIEKHFTLDRQLPGPDHQSSLEPGEMAEMIKGIRTIELALGRKYKFPALSELANRVPVRKSIVAGQDIAAGDAYHDGNLALKRPGDGISAIRYWDYLGKTADRPYRKDEQIDS